MSGQLATVVHEAGPEPSAKPGTGSLAAEWTGAPADRPSPHRALKLDQRALLCFYPEPLRPLTIQEVQRTLGVTYKPAYQALIGLVARGVLSEERREWTRSFRADCSSPACAREFVLLEWARGEAFLPGLPDGERERVEAFARRAAEETTPLFIRTIGSGEGPVQILAVIARAEERSQVALIARELALAVSVATLEVTRHILGQRPDLAAPLLQGICLHGAEAFVQERFRSCCASRSSPASRARPARATHP